MKVQQISVFLENRTGRMADAARLLSEANVNIRALSLADTSDFGILRLIVDRVDQAIEVLRGAGYTCALTDVVVIEIPDHPGGLAEVLQTLQDSSINVEYLYAFVEKEAIDKAVVVFRFDNLEAAVDTLKGTGITFLPAERVYKL